MKTYASLTGTGVTQHVRPLSPPPPPRTTLAGTPNILHARVSGGRRLVSPHSVPRNKTDTGMRASRDRARAAPARDERHGLWSPPAWDGCLFASTGTGGALCFCRAPRQRRLRSPEPRPQRQRNPLLANFGARVSEGSPPQAGHGKHRLLLVPLQVKDSSFERGAANIRGPLFNGRH